MSKANQWINRTEIRSESSDRVYVVSQHAVMRHWACSCPSWRVRRRCKHLEELGLPGGEEPFEVPKDHSKRKGFLDGYKHYDAAEGYGSRANWQETFAQRMGLDDARQALGLAADAGWGEVRQAFQLAATESMARLVGDYERAAEAFGDGGAAEQQAQSVQAAKFRLEAYAAYLEEQHEHLEAEAARITGALLVRLKAS